MSYSLLQAPSLFPTGVPDVHSSGGNVMDEAGVRFNVDPILENISR